MRKIPLLSFSKTVPIEVREQRLKNTALYCQMCGICPGDVDEFTGMHAKFRADWLPNNGLSARSEYPDLRVLCSTCYYGSRQISKGKPSASWLLAQIRRASPLERRAAYDSLKRDSGRNWRTATSFGESS